MTDGNFIDLEYREREKEREKKRLRNIVGFSVPDGWTSSCSVPVSAAVTVVSEW